MGTRVFFNTYWGTGCGLAHNSFRASRASFSSPPSTVFPYARVSYTSHHAAGPEVGVSSACCTGAVVTVTIGRGAVRWQRVIVGVSLRNRDAGDSDARHFADGHLEQEIQHLEGLAVPACQRSGDVDGVIFSVGLDRQVGSRGRSIR